MFRHIFLLILFAISTSSSFAFQTDTSTKTLEKSDSLKTNDFYSVNWEFDDCLDVFPTYPGGINQFRKDVAKSYVIPGSFRNGKNTGGTIITQFTISPEGIIEDVLIEKGIENCDKCNRNAVKAIEAIPEKFTPGYHDGEAVYVRYTFPITIKIDNTKKKKKKRSM